MARKGYGRKYRRCPACGLVRTASDFKPVASYYADPPTRCPACGHLGPRWSFVEVDPPEDLKG